MLKNEHLRQVLDSVDVTYVARDNREALEQKIISHWSRRVFRDRHLGEVLCAAFATRKAMTEALSALKDKDKLAFRAVKASSATEGQLQPFSKEQIARAIAECRPGG